MEKKIVVIAGEPSGDLHASLLVSKLKELDKNPAYIEKVLKDGAEKVRPLAEKTISEVKKKIGLG